MWHLCSLKRNVNGPFVSWTEHSLDHSYLELFVTLTKAMTSLTRWRWQALDKLRNFRHGDESSMELSFPGTFVPWNFRHLPHYTEFSIWLQEICGWWNNYVSRYKPTNQESPIKQNRRCETSCCYCLFNVSYWVLTYWVGVVVFARWHLCCFTIVITAFFWIQCSISVDFVC